MSSCGWKLGGKVGSTTCGASWGSSGGGCVVGQPPKRTPTASRDTAIAGRGQARRIKNLQDNEARLSGAAGGSASRVCVTPPHAGKAVWPKLDTAPPKPYFQRTLALSLGDC